MRKNIPAIRRGKQITKAVSAACTTPFVWKTATPSTVSVRLTKSAMIQSGVTPLAGSSLGLVRYLSYLTRRTT
jgi:hypothetical protein